ncbi:MAG: YHYH protein [Bacteroidetes bacterium]|nr:YHYH protein [Bacteroidota bacterium]
MVARGRRRPALGYGIAAVIVLGSLAYSMQTNASMRKLVLGTDPASIDSMFSHFKPHVTTRWDDTYFYVENDGMPTSMPAMKGITAWQQQVPIPQNYVGANAWQIPLYPVPAATPISLHTAFHTGAVAIAANGLPIFNPENNRGEFSYDIGELDAFGGHCGRADDYHYHIAPVHLANIIGTGLPVAWALDGYPLYGYSEPDGSAVEPLDASLGHNWHGGYHYHATKTRPYMMAQMYGKVTLDKDQVMPQPQTKGVRPFLQPLNGAEITDMHKCDDKHYVLKYTVNGATNWVNYMWNDSNKYTFTFVSPNGTRRVENYTRK